jgi:uncharacterized protein YndB with AHSA1/START domain
MSSARGSEHVRWEAVVQKMEPERLFSFTWHPYAIDPNQDYSGEPPTLVEFTLQTIATGTLLRVVESGFDKLPEQASPRSLPHERQRLESAGPKHRGACRTSAIAGLMR